MKKAPKPIIEVIWDDAAGNDGWAKLEDIEEHGPSRCYSIGYLLKETPDSITLSMALGVDENNDQDEIDQVGAYLIIPVGMIVDRRKIR